MITLKSNPGDKVLELGGGDNPQVRPNCDCRPGPNVDIVADFNKPLPFKDEEWDGVFSQFAIEHIAYPNVPSFLLEVQRILKPGGKFICVMPNTQAQLAWVQAHPDGWDDKGPFEASSELLYGSQDYPENSHRSYFSPGLVDLLFKAAGFTNLEIQAYGERDTDLCVAGVKEQKMPGITLTSLPSSQGILTDSAAQEMFQAIQRKEQVIPTGKALPFSREECFDKHYFNGGSKVGGYTHEGYRNFHCQFVTAQHVLERQPKSVFEIGAARGYVLKRLEDCGVPVLGLEISKHCYMTRAVESIISDDICNYSWKVANKYDLCFSIAVLEHIPEEFLPGVIRGMTCVANRGLHGIDFGGKDDGQDKTHCTLRPLSFWRNQFNQFAPGWSVEIVDKEELERFNSSVTKAWFDRYIIQGDGRLKVNIGSHMQMFYFGWENLDILPLNDFAQHNFYKFRQWDVTTGLPYNTNSVDMIFSSHFLERLNYKDGLKFLRECRRVIKPDGQLRLIVPDAELLMDLYYSSTNDGDKGFLSVFSEVNDGVEAAPTQLAKLHALLYEGGHQSVYDEYTLFNLLSEAGFSPMSSSFRKTQFPRMREQTVDSFPCLSLYVDAVPSV